MTAPTSTQGTDLLTMAHIFNQSVRCLFALGFCPNVMCSMYPAAMHVEVSPLQPNANGLEAKSSSPRRPSPSTKVLTLQMSVAPTQPGAHLSLSFFKLGVVAQRLATLGAQKSSLPSDSSTYHASQPQQQPAAKGGNPTDPSHQIPTFQCSDLGHGVDQYAAATECTFSNLSHGVGDGDAWQ